MGTKTTRHTKTYPGGTAVTTETTATTGRRAVRKATSGRAGKPPAKKATWSLNLRIWTYNSATGQHTFKLGRILKVKSKTRTQRVANKNAKAKTRAAAKQAKETARQKDRAALAAYFDQQTAPQPQPAQPIPLAPPTAQGSPRPTSGRRTISFGPRPSGESGSRQVVTASRRSSPGVVHRTRRGVLPGQMLAGDPAAGGLPRCPGCRAVMPEDAGGVFSCPNSCGTKVIRASQSPDPGPTTGAPGPARGAATTARPAGICGAPTKDRSPCQRIGHCPHHSRSRPTT